MCKMRFQRIYDDDLSQPKPLILNNKGRYNESTIRGHRKILNPRWDSSLRVVEFYCYII